MRRVEAALSRRLWRPRMGGRHLCLAIYRRVVEKLRCIWSIAAFLWHFDAHMASGLNLLRGSRRGLCIERGAYFTQI